MDLWTGVDFIFASCGPENLGYILCHSYTMDQSSVHITLRVRHGAAGGIWVNQTRFLRQII